MPIIDHAHIRWTPAMQRVRERYLVSQHQGTVSLTIMEFPNPWDGRGYGNNMVFPFDVVVSDR